MPDERMRILTMLADGKITADEADQLLRAVEEARASESGSKSPGRPTWLRIRITVDGVEKVNFTVPLTLARMGLALLPSSVMLRINEKGIDLDRLLQTDMTEAGTLITVEDGANKVEVFVE